MKPNKIKEKVLKELWKKRKGDYDSDMDEIVLQAIDLTLAETEKETEKLKEKIKDLEHDLLAYRRPRGSSVMNVREDERKKTLAEVNKVIDELGVYVIGEPKFKVYAVSVKELKQKLGGTN